MCQQHLLGHSPAGLPEYGAVKIEEFADAALGVYNCAVYLADGQVDKAGRDLDQQRLEAQALFQFMLQVGIRLPHGITLGVP